MRVAAAVLAIVVLASGCASVTNSAAGGRTVAPTPSETSSGIVVGTASVAGAAPPSWVTAVPPQPSRTAPRVLGAGAVLTDDDWNATVRLRAGQRVRILLRSGLPFRWRPVRSSSPAVADIVDAAGADEQPTVRAGVVARSPGRAWLTSSTEARCFHNRVPCLAAVRQWVVAVVVRP